jgi:trk system potassium uptake protein TrkA
VAIGEFEANLLAVVAVRHLGARHVVAKALTPRQAEILLRIGVDEVVLPEQEAGERLALRLLAPNISRDLMEHTGILAGERPVPQQWVGQSLGHIHLRQRHGVLAIAIRRGTELLIAPGADDIFQVEDQVVLVGDEERLKALGCRLPVRAS